MKSGRRPTQVLRAGPLFVGLALWIGCASIEIPSDPGADAMEADGAVFSHASWGRFLDTHVRADGRLDYTRAQDAREDLDHYVRALAETSPDTHPHLFPDGAERLAYWLNAYNAWVVYAVLEAYPVASVQDINDSRWLAVLPDGAGFFLFQRITLGGRRTSLYALENFLIRKRFDDARVHFALNCASQSCPRLPREPFEGAVLEAQLQRETRGFLAETRNVEIETAAGVLRLSSIFRWYRRDFDAPAGARGETELHRFLDAALEADMAAKLRRCGGCRIEWRPYDWRLNDTLGPAVASEAPARPRGARGDDPGRVFRRSALRLRRFSR